MEPLPEDRWYRGAHYAAGATNYPENLGALIAVEQGNRRVNGERELIQRFGAEVANALQAAGLVNMNAIHAAADTALLAIPGLGRATLKKIRGDVPSALTVPEVTA